jgi:predicted transcriptional regulator
MTKIHLKNKAVSLRKEGYSYTDIQKMIGVSKSTLSDWLSNLKYTPNKIVRDRLIKARIFSSLAKSKIKNESIARASIEAKDEISHYTERELLFVGLGVYMGEGTKTKGVVRIINSDPKIIRLMILWFKNVFGIKMDNLRLRMHIYPDIVESEAMEYWSRETGLKKNQFMKTQVDLRVNKSLKNKGRLPYGTVQLSIKAMGNKDWGVFLSRKILALMAQILK